MSGASIYANRKDCDLRDMINHIMQVSKVAAAGTDSALTLDNMDYSYGAVFEVIYEIADRAYTIADDMMDELEKVKKVG